MKINHELSLRIDEISKELKEQIRSVISKGQSEISDFAIEIKTDENKDVVRFVVHANDVLNTKQIHITNAVVDVLEEILDIKKDIILSIESLENSKITPASVAKKVLKIVDKVSSIKTVLILLLVIVVFILFLIYPDKTISLLNAGGFKSMLGGMF